MQAYLEDLKSKIAAATATTTGRRCNLVAIKPTGWTFGSHRKQEHHQASPVDVMLADPLPTPEGSSSKPDRSYHDQLLDCVLPPHTQRGFDVANIRPFGHSSELTIFPVPYSEHSSYRELAAFVCSLPVDEVISTVPTSSLEATSNMQRL
ncbi:repair protein PSO2 SNM1, partial [Spiromyces aspiralis]